MTCVTHTQCGRQIVYRESDTNCICKRKQTKLTKREGEREIERGRRRCTVHPLFVYVCIGMRYILGNMCVCVGGWDGNGNGGGVVYSLYNRLQRERDARSSPHETATAAAAAASAAALTFQMANCELRTAAALLLLLLLMLTLQRKI